MGVLKNNQLTFPIELYTWTIETNALFAVFFGKNNEQDYKDIQKSWKYSLPSTVVVKHIFIECLMHAQADHGSSEN